MFKKEFHITNITCEACIKLGKMALEEIPDVTSATIDSKTGKTVVVSGREIPKEEIKNSLEVVGKTTDI